ncbi:50S ribosomal protein L4 [Candidatus Bandiella euplotis]|uniref:Large ribosomal subunit protein uL4 n=1 Tax=Candidatus Bandiella euplotis TaxID=1664265 RepID=A0ABZ0UND6_9RICK|nr:50S ribosomal protein L4 [Candidatus Bandiella woodruffii]WPX96781.1 50S ribosomal protein L4 [Candidatus Bandiella woodruffii]
MELEVLDFEKKPLRKVDASILNLQSIRHDLIHQIVVWQLAKKRSAIAHAKGVSEVSGSTRKIYKQKGTGRARHGSNRRVQFRGGGVIFGPTKDKVFDYKINKKVKKLGLLNALALKFKDKSISIHERFEIEDGKTKTFNNMYSNSDSKKMLFIDNEFDAGFLKSMRNRFDADVLPVMGLNVLDVIKHDKICFSEQAFNSVLERLR